ncbi:hypothetical protein Ancab_035690 [Ancistrocladus abbreviatus]
MLKFVDVQDQRAMEQHLDGIRIGSFRLRVKVARSKESGGSAETTSQKGSPHYSFSLRGDEQGSPLPRWFDETNHQLLFNCSRNRMRNFLVKTWSPRNTKLCSNRKKKNWSGLRNV